MKDETTKSGHGRVELTDDDLRAVSGGRSGLVQNNEPVPCAKCGEMMESGIVLAGGTFYCSACYYKKYGGTGRTAQ